MNKKIIFCFFIGFLICFPASIHAANIDSLKIELNRAKEDTNKVNLFINIAGEYVENDFLKGRINAEKALVISNKLNYSVGKVKCLDIIGLSYFLEGKYDIALSKYNLALSIKTDRNKTIYSKTYLHIGNVYRAQSDLNEALKYYLKAAKLFEKDGSKKEKAIVYMNLALVYKNQNIPIKALEYNNKALVLFKEINDINNQIKVSTNMIGVYLMSGQIDEALKLSLATLDKSESYSNQFGILDCCGYIGYIYAIQQKHKKAIIYYLKSIKIGEELNDKFGIAISNANLSQAYKAEKSFDKAIFCLEKAKSFFKDNGMRNEMKDVYKDLSDISEQKKDYQQSLIYYKQYSELKDSIFNESNSQQINEALTKYETEKKEKEIIVLNADLLSKKKDKVILQGKVQKRNSIISGTISGSILLITTIILLYNRRRLIQRNLHQLEINQQRDNTTASIVQAQEKEQTRIAKELHDSIGTFLSTLKINLQLYEELIPQNKTEGYQNALNLIDKISVELRNIMKNLSNETLQENGLVKAFDELVFRINDLEITKIDFHTNGIINRLEEGVEHNLYRIAQELLNNCIKHAKAKKATIQLIDDEENITLMFEDDGIGFDVDSPLLKNKNHGMGLKNIYNRVNFIKGTIRIESSAKNGSIFIIEVPKNKSLQKQY